MHGAGGVGGNKFHHHTLALAVIAAAVVAAQRGNVLQHIHIKAGREEEIQKARASDFKAVEIGAVKHQMLCDQLGNFARGQTERAGRDQRGVGGPVPVGAVGRDFERKGGHRFCGQFFCGNRAPHGVQNGFSQLISGLLY